MIVRFASKRGVFVCLGKFGLLFFALTCIVGCSHATVEQSPSTLNFTLPNEAQGELSSPSLAPTFHPTPSPEPTIENTPEPTPSYVTVGAVGDIMIMESQVKEAWSSDIGGYDFSPAFEQMSHIFLAADIVAANLETPLAGEENGGYSGPAPAAPVPNADGTIPKKELQTFNAPDALANAMLESGIDVITTANNHVLDRGVDGAFRTIEVIRDVGLYQTGSYLSNDDRNTHACIVEENGIRVGFIGWTFSINGYESMMTSEQEDYLVGRNRDEDGVLADIATVKNAGADFIIALPHWDFEFAQEPDPSTRAFAEFLLENGVDAIFGSHPHVAQPIEYVTVDRGEGEYTGLVVFSLANHISNMEPSPEDFGVYVQITLEKDPISGEVSLYNAAYLPTYCDRDTVDGLRMRRVYPAYATDTGPLLDAYNFVTSICGNEIDIMSNDS